MLVDPKFIRPDLVVSLVASMHGGPAEPRRISQGVYIAGHWNVRDMVPTAVDWLDGGTLEFDISGVCDTPVQVVERLKLDEIPQPVFVSCVHIRRADQPLQGGWRWHKWGKYIGDHDPQFEYLHDEPLIEQVYTFSVIELEGKV